MSRTIQFQAFLLFLALGFLAGPRVMEALQKTEALPSGSGITAITAQEFDSNELFATATTKKEIQPFDDLGLEAESVYVWDINAHRVLYQKNSKRVLPLASVTKMMMALVAVELLPIDQQIAIQAVDLEEEGDSGLFVGEKWTLASLLKFTLVASSNDGASAIASVAGATLLPDATSTNPFENKKLFIAKMNEKAKSIGLVNTEFTNESGLDIDSVTSGAYGTSRDMAMLFEYIFRKHPELFSPTTYAKIDVSSEDNIVHHVSNTNAGVSTISGLIGSKTGYTDLAGGNLVVLVDIGLDHPVVISVLGSTRTGRFLDVEKLINATVKTITSQPTVSTTNSSQ